MLYPDPAPPLLSPWTAAVGFFLGAIAGSFLNMLIWRLPRGKSLVDPAHSICPRCDHRLTALDLMPILSWLRTGGRCRHCKEPIAARYLWVEVLVGSLFALVWLQTMCVGLDPQVVPFALKSLAAATLVAIVFIDGELYIIPDELNAALLAIGLGYGAYRHAFPSAVLGAFVGWALLWGFVFLGRIAFGKDAMGDGDIKMMRGVGAVLGPTLVLANVGIGVVLGLIGGLAGLAIEARRKGGTTPATGATVEEEAPIEATPIPLVLLAAGRSISSASTWSPSSCRRSRAGSRGATPRSCWSRARTGRPRRRRSRSDRTWPSGRSCACWPPDRSNGECGPTGTTRRGHALGGVTEGSGRTRRAFAKGSRPPKTGTNVPLRKSESTGRAG